MKNEKFKGCLQIVLLVVSVFAFSYIISDLESGEVYLEIKTVNVNWGAILRAVVSVAFNEKSLVSAQGVVLTCVDGEKGVCQEYFDSEECENECSSACLPQTKDSVSACELGRCFDSDEGICSEGATRGKCEVEGGQFVDSNNPICNKGCCKIGDDTDFVTSRQCGKIGEVKGIETEYYPNDNELECWNRERTKEEGACVFGIEEEKSCRFITKENCLEGGGEFYAGMLCTHEDFSDIGYEKQADVKCDDSNGKLYWVDSVGNKENIYDANKDKSWNGGEVLVESESCSLESGNNPFGNQGTCGNCERLLGSVCGERTSDESLSGNYDYVCKDIRCRDSSGNVRQNGESWCEYQGAIGVREGSGYNGGELSGLIGKELEDGERFTRSIDTPGSRHFRASCIDGEVTVNACDEYRNKVCSESVNERESDNVEISSAACVVNPWQLCMSYNSEIERSDDKEEVLESIEKRNELCLENPTCALKNINIADNFKFDFCVPRYSPGFDLEKNPEGGEMSCGSASQKCKVVWVKKITGWKVEVNAGCLEPKFAEQMNDLCMSLGDCGASVNYQGDFTENYRVKKSPKLNDNYIDEISEYSKPVEEVYVEINTTKYLKAIGGSELFGTGELGYSDADLQTGGMVASGVSGILLMASQFEPIAGFEFLANPGWQAAGGAIAGAAIGFAVTAMLIKYTGVGGGLDPELTDALIAAGALAGAMVGYAAATTGAFTFVGTVCLGVCWFPVIGWAIAITLITIIIVLAALGIGDTRERTISFECEPWQPPLGGDGCNKCGDDGYGCSKYSCQALGAGCRLINEGSNEMECVNIGEGDVTAPVIEPFEEALSEGFGYTGISGNGFKVVSEEGDGCVKADDNLVFGISLDEPGWCAYEFEHTGNFDEMENDFGGRNLYLEEHVENFNGFNLRELADLDLPEYDPDSRVDFNFYVRCIDFNGNHKDSSEYVINFCVKPGEDIGKPFITAQNPSREEIAFDSENVGMSIFVSEPADCRWGLDSTDNYDLMENNFTCANAVGEKIPNFGWNCLTSLPTENDENKFYVRCLDQPWKNETFRAERNEMENNYEIVLKKTLTPLSIDSITPMNETLEFGVEPASVELVVETSGGADGGRATCYFNEIRPGNELADTFGTIHKNTFNRIFSGGYNIPIRCKDFVGNTAESELRFSALLDVKFPEVSRAYKQGGSLIVITTEEGKCAYVKDTGKSNSCNFNFENATLMNGIGLTHTTQFDGSVHYIKCEDRFGNKPGGCSVIVKGGY